MAYSNNIPYQPMVTSAYPTGTSTFQFPTRWTMRQAWMWSDMHIKDPLENTIYRAENKVLSVGWNLNFFDAQSGALLGKIKQEIRLGMPKYSIILDDAEFATVKQEFTFFKPTFTIQSRNGPISVEGDWTAHSYTFKRGEYIIATVSKAWTTMRDTYTVDIAAGENVVFILSCCIVIDKCCTKN